MCVLVLQCISPTIGDVKYAARMGETHEPWGTLVSMERSSSLFPSKQMVAHRSLRKEKTHWVIGRGRWYERRVLRRWEWGMVSKNLVMLNVSMGTLCLWFQAVSML